MTFPPPLPAATAAPPPQQRSRVAISSQTVKEATKLQFTVVCSGTDPAPKAQGLWICRHSRTSNKTIQAHCAFSILFNSGVDEFESEARETTVSPPPPAHLLRKNAINARQSIGTATTKANRRHFQHPKRIEMDANQPRRVRICQCNRIGSDCRVFFAALRICCTAKQRDGDRCSVLKFERNDETPVRESNYR
jgi:hypothetical protein